MSFAMPLSRIEFADKKSARLYFLDKRALISPDEKARLDALIAERLYEAVRGFDTVLLFSAVRGEICLDALAERLLREGRQVAFPVSHTHDTRLEFKRLSSLAELSAGAYGIPEPPQENETLFSFDGAVCITPALALDESGYRLGYGKGYYDRFFEKQEIRRIGVTYDGLLARSLPHAERDVPVNVIVTEKGIKIIS